MRIVLHPKPYQKRICFAHQVGQNICHCASPDQQTVSSRIRIPAKTDHAGWVKLRQHLREVEEANEARLKRSAEEQRTLAARFAPKELTYRQRRQRAKEQLAQAKGREPVMRKGTYLWLKKIGYWQHNEAPAHFQKKVKNNFE
jgi:hypothetical protein